MLMRGLTEEVEVAEVRAGVRGGLKVLECAAILVSAGSADVEGFRSDCIFSMLKGVLKRLVYCEPGVVNLSWRRLLRGRPDITRQDLRSPSNTARQTKIAVAVMRDKR